MSRTSLRVAVTAAVVALVASSLAALAVSLYLGVAGALGAQRDRALLGRARTLAALVEHDDEDGFEIERPAEDDAVWQVWRPDGTVLGRSRALAGKDLAGRAGTFDAPALDDVTLPDGRRARRISVRFVPRNEGERAVGEVTLALAEDGADVAATLGAVRAWFWLAGAITLVIVGATTAWLVSRGLSPLSRLAGQIARIDDRGLAARLPEEDQPAELVAPVRKLNQLLGRLEESFGRERRFTADASHELRTPLAGLRTLLEVTARHERAPAEYQAALADALAIALELGRLVESLLTLARAEEGHGALAPREVALARVVDDAWRPHAERAARRGLTLRNAIPAGALLQADPESLRVVVGELLANAVAYTEAGGWIEATAEAGAVIAISDSGPEIPAGELERIFDRFWRGSTGRPTGSGHSGIGLSLVRALCTRAGWRISAHNRAGGGVAFVVRDARPTA